MRAATHPSPPPARVSFVLHRPLRRPLAAVLLFSLVDYALWNWSLGANHDIIALVAGLTLVPLLIALTWLLVLGATRIAGDVTRRARESAATRAQARSAAAPHRARRASGGRTARAGARGARGGAATRSSAHGRPVASGTGEEATASASSSKLAA